MPPYSPPWTRRAALCSWLLFLPLLLSWGLGTTHDLVDLLAVPGAALATVPSLLGPWGAAAVFALAALRWRAPRLAARPPLRSGRSATMARLLGPLVDGLGLWGLLAFLGPALAATRPLPWVPLLVTGLAWVRGWGDERGRAFDLGDAPRGLVGAGLWLAASRVRPFGDGLLPGSWEDAIASVVPSLPDALLTGPAILLALLAGALLYRRGGLDRRGVVVGAGLGLLVEVSFGLRSAWLSAAMIGAVGGAWPTAWGRVERLAGPLLLAAGLSALRVGTLERWNCGTIEHHPVTRLLLARSDLRSIGVVPGNLPYLVALGRDGAELERFSTTGIINETRPVDPPGGRLVSTGGEDAPLLRLVDGPEGLVVEWWQASVMARIAVVRTSEPCQPEDAGYEPVSQRVWVACQDGDVVTVDRDHPAERWDLPGRTRDLDQAPGSVVRLRRGPLGELVLRDPAGRVQAATFVGPYAEDADPGPELLVIARGPAGQIVLRGAPPSIPDRPGGEPKLEGTAALQRDISHVLDRVRVGSWPSQVRWSLADRSIYVTSEVGARVTLVDAQVPWHQADAPLGAPPRQVVIDSSSGTLYGVNRCGVFEVRIPTTFPWASTGDVDEPPKGATPDPQGATPDPQGATPDPQGATPDPQGATPDPQGATPDPQGATPDPEDPR